MNDLSEANRQLIEEISALKNRIQKLEQSESERKRAEEELRISRQQLRLLIDAAPDLFFLKNLHLRYQLVNSANARFFGREQADILGRTDIDFMPEEAAVACQRSDRQAIYEKRTVVTTEQLGDRLYETHKFPVIDGDEVIGVAGVIRDITDRKRTEERFEKLNEVFLRFSPDPIANIKLLVAFCGEMFGATCAFYNRLEGDTLYTLGQWNAPPDFRFVDKSEGHLCTDVIKSDRDDMVIIRNLQDSPYAQTDPNVRPYRLQTYIGKAVTFAHAHIGSLCVVFHRDVIPSDNDARLMGIIASAIGVEENRKRAELALVESEFKYHTVVEHSLGGVYIIQDGLFRFVNKQFCNIFGYTHEEILDTMSPLDIVHSDDRHVVEELLRKLLAGEIEDISLTHRAVRKDGTTITVKVLGSTFTYSGRQAGSGTVYDITEQEKAEEQLRQKTALLEAQVNTSLDGILIVDRGKKILQNQQMNDLLKIPRHIAESDDDGPQVEWVRGLAKNPERFREKVAYMFAHPDETMRDELELTDGTVLDRYSSPVIGNDGKNYGRIWTFRDITERKLAEERLKTVNKQLEETIEFLPDATFIIDRDKKIIAWNRAMEDMTGVPKKDIVGKNHVYSAVPFYGEPRPYLMDLIDKDDEEIASKYNYVKRRGDVLYAEVFTPALYDDKGAYIWATASSLRDSNGALIGAIESIRDITERKQAEDALERAEKKYRDIFENSIMGIFQTTPEGRYLNVNKALSRMFGFDSPEEMIQEVTNITTQQYVNPEDRERLTEQYRTVGSVVGFETQIYRKDGRKVWISLNGRAVKDSNGNILYYEGTTEDITGRKRSEEEKVRLENQLLHAQKMEAIGTLSGGIAHDFNNILTALIGYGTLLQMGLDRDDPLRLYVDEILSSSEKAAQLTHGLLAFSRKQPITLKPVKLNDIIGGTKKLLERLLTEDIELRTRFTSDDTTIMADTTQIDQILFNLVTNARDAMPKGGALILETKRVELGKEFKDVHGYGEPGVFALLSVTDTGCGMNNETREHAFDPFFTTKEVGKGTGLGLPTVYGIVKQHKGHINIYSEPNMGTTFHIYLPVVNETGKEDSRTADLAKRGNEIILVAEDNEAVRGLISKILTEYGYTTVEAIDGADAVERFGKADKIDLLILDSVMPKKNGREAYDEIHKIKPDVRVIFTSGYTRDVFLDKGIEDKKFNFLQKPISPGALLQKVREALDDEQLC